jgi:hypothetical protein
LGTEDQQDGVSFDENVDAYGRPRHPRQGARKALSDPQQTFAMPAAHVNRHHVSRHAVFGGPLRHQIAPQNYEINWQLGPLSF